MTFTTSGPPDARKNGRRPSPLVARADLLTMAGRALGGSMMRALGPTFLKHARRVFDNWLLELGRVDRWGSW